MWDTIARLLSDPVWGKVLVPLLVIVAGWGITLALRLLVRSWRKMTVARFGLIPSSLKPWETKLDVLQKAGSFVVYFLVVLVIIAAIPQLLVAGTTLLAAFGLLGIVTGLAAQATLSNLIAGVSIGFSQPVRLNDNVVYEGDWGTIEEITLMHTVICTWDNRRLVVPNSVMNSTVIQNWSLKEEWLQVAVSIYVDYSCNVEQLRKWATEIVGESPHATEDKIAVVEVVGLSEKAMEVRVLSKSPDSRAAWRLRCEIREKMVKKLQEAGMPLPQIRVWEVGTKQGAAAS